MSRLRSDPPRRSRCLCPVKTWQFRSQWGASPRIPLLHCTLQTREVTGNRCLRQRWCQTREVFYRVHVLACLLASMHACMPFCMLHPAKSPTISPFTTFAQSREGCLDGHDACADFVLMTMLPAQILTLRRHCTAPSSLSGRRD